MTVFTLECCIDDWTPGNYVEFPKYFTQIINIASQNSQATRTKNVGSMKNLFNEWFMNQSCHSRDSWKNFYDQRFGVKALSSASKKIEDNLTKIFSVGFSIHFESETRSCISERIQKWVEMLIYTQTYDGMIMEYHTVKTLANYHNMEFSMSNLEEEKQGIDARIGSRKIQIKKEGSFKPSLFMNQIKKDVVLITYKFNPMNRNLILLQRTEDFEIMKM